MADAIHGSTEIDAVKQELVANVVLKELAASANLVPTISDYSAFAVPGAKTVKVPKLTNFTAVDRASAVAGDATVLTSSTVDLALDQCAYIAWIVDSCDLIQSSIDMELFLAQRAATAHGRFVDSKILAALEADSTATTTAGAISKDIVLEMRAALCTAFGDLNNLTLAVGCDSEKTLLGVAEFIDASVYGSSQPIQAGQIGRLYGVPVVVNTGIGATTYYMYDRSAMGIAFQQAPSMSKQGANEYGSGAMRTVMDQLFGVKSLLTTLLIKDNN